MYCGYVCLAYFWAQVAAIALPHLERDDSGRDFYQAKLATATFYYRHILPRTRTCVAVIDAGAADLMGLPEESFQF